MNLLRSALSAAVKREVETKQIAWVALRKRAEVVQRARILFLKVLKKTAAWHTLVYKIAQLLRHHKRPFQNLWIEDSGLEVCRPQTSTDGGRQTCTAGELRLAHAKTFRFLLWNC